MSTTLRTGILFLLLAPPASAQIDFGVSGYAVNFPIYQRINPTLAGLFGIEEHQFVDVTRIRIRPSAGLWSDAFLMLEYEINATYFSSPLPFPVTSTRSSGQVFDLTWNPISEARWNLVHFIDRLYLKQITDILDLTVGRQRISWGTGRVWNPTDLFNPINPTSFAKVEKDGVDAILAKFILGNFTDLSVVMNPRDKWEGSNFGARFRSNIDGFDVSLMGGSFDKRRVLGIDFAGSILDAGIRGEAIVSRIDRTGESSFVKYILGVDNQFTEEFYALAEYHYNGQGKTHPQEYDVFALQQGLLLNLGKQFVALQGTYLIHPLVSAVAGYTRSVTDGSGFIIGTVSYSATGTATLSLGGQIFHGDEFEEFWYYPTSAYFRLEYFF